MCCVLQVLLLIWEGRLPHRNKRTGAWTQRSNAAASRALPENACYATRFRYRNRFKTAAGILRIRWRLFVAAGWRYEIESAGDRVGLTFSILATSTAVNHSCSASQVFLHRILILVAVDPLALSKLP